MRKICIYFQLILIWSFISIYDSAWSYQRLPRLNDFLRIKTVSEPDLSKNGKWVVYTVEENVNQEEAVKNIWLVSYDGTVSKKLTHDKKNSSYTPKWSPDGQWIAFLSEIGDSSTTSLKLLHYQSKQIINLTGDHYEISDFTWAPDSQSIAFIATKTQDKKNSKNKPIVITRYQFKEDRTGYLSEERTHLYRLSIQNKQVKLLTAGNYDEWSPAWSPNGEYIAFVTRKGIDPDRHLNSNIYVINPTTGRQVIQLTHYPAADMDPEWESIPSWSPDSSQIVYIRSSRPQLIYYTYAPTELAVVGISNSREHAIAPVDRWFSIPKWSDEGNKIYALMEISRNTHLSEIDVHTGVVKILTKGFRVDKDFSVANHRLVLVSSDDQHPDELFALEEDGLRPLTHHNQKLVQGVKFLPLEDIEFNSFDGTRIEGLLLKPTNYIPGKQYPAILNLHGGPVDQFRHEFNFDLQWLAAQGYTIIAPNPRGSSGRGFAFSRAIYADWGNLDAKDAIAAVDYAIMKGIVDPNKLAVGGWSYGGMLTDYIIASTPRFKAAVSGAGTGNLCGNYGVDQYTLEYEMELGKPWLNSSIYTKLSYPFMKAYLIKTPTLFFCASLDFNMPCIGSEQLYQALKSQNIPTQLVIYPEQYHSLDRPDFQIDYLKRFKDWIDFYLK